MGKSLKEVVKEQYGVDTLTTEEAHAEFKQLGWTKEQVKAYFESNGNSKEQVERIMNDLYPRNKKD